MKYKMYLYSVSTNYSITGIHDWLCSKGMHTYTMCIFIHFHQTTQLPGCMTGWFRKATHKREPMTGSLHTVMAVRLRAILVNKCHLWLYSMMTDRTIRIIQVVRNSNRKSRGEPKYTRHMYKIILPLCSMSWLGHQERWHHIYASTCNESIYCKATLLFYYNSMII